MLKADSYETPATLGVRGDNRHLLKQTDDAEFLLQNSNNLAFETKQITSFSCDQSTQVNLSLVVLGSETKERVDVRRRDFEGLNFGDPPV